MPWVPRCVPYIALLAVLGAAMMAGLLFAFSNFVIRALSQLPPASGMEAMQRINVAIVNPIFLVLFLGTPVLCLLTVIASLELGPSAGRPYLLAGAVCYLGGVLGVTILFNVPLNGTLARLGPSAAPEHWPQYVTTWLRWNHVRTIFAILSTVLLTVGVHADSATGRS
jgi:uncharacterized membrane protein